MKKILLLTDFSEASHHALQYACSFLSDTVADIHLLYACPPETVGLTNVKNEFAAATGSADEHIQDFVAGLRRGATNARHTFRATARVGTLPGVVQAVLQEEPYDYVVMGVGKDSGRAVLSNAITELVKQLRTNVMVIPADVQPGPVCHVALAADFANLRNCRLLLPIKELVTLKGALLTLLSVDVPGKDVIRPQQELRIRRFLKPVSPSVAHVQASEPKQGINQFIADHRIDLLVTITRYKYWTDTRTGPGVARLPDGIPSVPMITLYDDGYDNGPKMITDLPNRQRTSQPAVTS